MTIGEGNPQLEDGYARIANEILEQLATTSLSDYESRCVHYLWRKTYGWADNKGQSKKNDVISVSQWSAGTLINRRNVWKVLKNLAQRGIFFKEVIPIPGKNTITLWSFNKRYNQWDKGIPQQLALLPSVVSSESTIVTEQVSSENTIVTEQVSSESTLPPTEKKPAEKTEVSSESTIEVSSESTIEVSSESTHTIDNKDNKTNIYIYTDPSVKTDEPAPPDNSDNKDDTGLTASLEKIKKHKGKEYKITQSQYADLKKLMGELKIRRGYKSPKSGMEVAAICWMFKAGYTIDDILHTYEVLLKQKFYSLKMCTMADVKNEIGNIQKGKPGYGQISSSEGLSAWNKN
jgi:phage replication O-like protein O